MSSIDWPNALANGVVSLLAFILWHHFDMRVRARKWPRLRRMKPEKVLPERRQANDEAVTEILRPGSRARHTLQRRHLPPMED